MTHTCTYKYEDKSKSELVIEFDYQPEERRTYDDPGCPAEIEITAVYANGIDILEWISDDSLEFFSDKCEESVAQAKEDAEYDRGEERYLDRLECV